MDVCDRLKLPAHWEHLRCVGGEAFPHAVCVCCWCVFHKRPGSGKTLWKYAAVLFFKLDALQWKQRESFRQEVDGGGGPLDSYFFCIEVTVFCILSYMSSEILRQHEHNAGVFWMKSSLILVFSVFFFLHSTTLRHSSDLRIGVFLPLFSLNTSCLIKVRSEGKICFSLHLVWHCFSFTP